MQLFSLDDSRAYLRWKNSKRREDFIAFSALPTEGMWEKAARGTNNAFVK
jgi:formylglycine-generating enzyme required for sulfatase activity